MSKPMQSRPDQLQAQAAQCRAEHREIEASWLDLRRHVIPLDAHPFQVDAMRSAYMAGVTHLFHIMMPVIDQLLSAQAADMTLIQQVKAEVDAFANEVLLRALREAGSA